jgi:hypothetical protein
VLCSAAEVVRARGIAGEGRVVKLVYLATTSRLLDRPANLAPIGPSSVGKSHAVMRTLELLPPDDVLRISGMSERAIAYDSADYSGRVILFDEASAFADRRSLALSLVRQLMANGVAEYWYVGQNAKTGERETRKIIKRGPVAVVVTTTAAALDPELETRLLRVHVDDSVEQTARVLATAAAQAAGSWPAPPDLGPWHAFQRWLRHGGPRQVIIPYAEVLAARIRPGSVMLRRDFPTVLSLIAAHALLHRASRAVDGAGRIVAALEDYGAVRELTLEAFAVSGNRRPLPAQRRVQGAVAAAAHGVFLAA